jgi:bifunctional UDP-N-acetylglucosamine pyrophosphorylase / glucosamine-1-phosphate N-acetyltransferase
MARSLLTVILAAGKGTRMRSALPKVLHRIAGRSMLGHVLALANGVGGDKLAVVVGPGMEAVRKEALAAAPGAAVFVQENQLGTADAVLAARDAIASHKGDLLVLFADTPLITAETVTALLQELERGASIAVLGFEAREPGAYGRLITAEDGTLVAIREAKDATDAERAVRLCNSGVMAFRLDEPLAVLDEILPMRSNSCASGVGARPSSYAMRTRCSASMRGANSPRRRRSGSGARATS